MYYMANLHDVLCLKRCTRTGNPISSLSPQKNVRDISDSNCSAYRVASLKKKKHTPPIADTRLWYSCVSSLSHEHNLKKFWRLDTKKKNVLLIFFYEEDEKKKEVRRWERELERERRRRRRWWRRQRLMSPSSGKKKCIWNNLVQQVEHSLHSLA